jgi:RimJ/RimL family protein N-acetyltransferase
MAAMERPMDVQRVVLEGEVARLEPLSLAHVDALFEVAHDPALWRWTLMRINERADLERWVEAAIAGREAGTELPFATVERATGRAIGSSRFLAIERQHRRVEIGWTWVAREWQRTAVNTEAKLLMLSHAFEAWGCHRVEFKTDSRNEQSRAALTRLGAVEEGTFRNHMVMPDGAHRHSVYFSVIAEEWAALRERLQERLAKPRERAEAAPTSAKS